MADPNSLMKKPLEPLSNTDLFLTLVLLRGGCTNPPNGFLPGAQNRTAKG